MPPPHPIPEQLLELVARRFHLLAEPTRLRLLDRLRDGDATVQELADELETSQQNVSKQLAMLAEAGILARRRDGTRVHYRIADEEVLGLCDVQLARARAAQVRHARRRPRGPTSHMNAKPME